MIGYEVANQMRASVSGGRKENSRTDNQANRNRSRSRSRSPTQSPSPKMTASLAKESQLGNSRYQMRLNPSQGQCADSSSISHSISALSMEKLAAAANGPLAYHLLPSRSPGYHSTASSPCSTADSPVSSSSASISSSIGSSGVSSGASSLSMNSRNQQQTSTSPFLLLDYFPQLSGDGIGLTWSHETNSRLKLTAALKSTKMMVTGDISLAEMSRYPLPIMARAPITTSDLTLENWLQEVTQVQPQKGIKLTFSSTRTVEPAFRVLARHADLLKGALILSADILTRTPTASSSAGSRGSAAKQSQQSSSPDQGQQPVDAWTFLMMCRTRFPRCTISIGWCSSPTTIETSADELSLTLEQSNEHLFDMDLLDSQSALNQLVGASRLGHWQNINQQQSRLSQSLHPYSLIVHQQQHQSQHLNHRSQNQGQHNSARLAHHHIVSSAGSLASSSGNSSGSPSPTSPVSQMMSPPSYQSLASNLSLLGSQDQARPQSSESAGAAAAAAAMTAALVAASTFQQQQQQHLPLNLNINEADRQLSSNLGQHQRLANYTKTQPSDSLAARLFGNNPNPQMHKKSLANSRSPNSSSCPSPKTLSGRLASGSMTSNLLLKTTGARVGHSGGYTREMIDKMASLVKEYNLTQPVTFPVEARRLMGNESLVELQRLLFQVGTNSSLTIVAQQDDLISVDELLLIRRSFAPSQLLFDLPERLAVALRRMELD